MSCRAGLGLLASLVLAEHHRVPQLEPLQQAAVGVLQGGERRENPWKNPAEGRERLSFSQFHLAPSWGEVGMLPFPAQPSSLRETLEKSHQPHPCWPCSVLAQSALLSLSQHV